MDIYLLDTVKSIQNKLEILSHLATTSALEHTYATLLEESFYQLQSLVEVYCVTDSDVETFQCD